MKKVIVTTTINPPTEAIKRFQAMEDWQLVVVGDKRTPRDYPLGRGTYLAPDDQERMDKALSDAIGWNSIQRRSFGLLWAHEQEADVVAVVDDDNIPESGWGQDLMIGRRVRVRVYETDLPAFDPIGATHEKRLWHRGYPLPLLAKRRYDRFTEKEITPHIQADFWNGDPDIDAICRMEHAPECTFCDADFPFAANRPSPFNSQNTFLLRKVLKDYFPFPHVGRQDDIWASYHVQARGYSVVYGRASVYQVRNEHDLIENMKQEYIGYENNMDLVKDLATDADALRKYLSPRSAEAFDLYQRHFE